MLLMEFDMLNVEQDVHAAVAHDWEEKAVSVPNPSFAFTL